MHEPLTTACSKEAEKDVSGAVGSSCGCRWPSHWLVGIGYRLSRACSLDCANEMRVWPSTPP